MAQLSDSQLVVLSTACQRPDRSVYPLTAKLPGGAVTKVLDSLLKKVLIREVKRNARTRFGEKTRSGAA